MGVGGMVYPFTLEIIEEHTQMSVRGLVYLIVLYSIEVVVVSAVEESYTTGQLK